jgi:hypothetical protein
MRRTSRRQERDSPNGYLQLHDPLAMLVGPRPHLAGRRAAATQQELEQSLTRAPLIGLRRLAGSNQISKRLVLGIRNPHGREVSRTQRARQLLRVATIGLDPIPRLDRNQSRRHHVTANAQLCELPIQHVPARACLVADVQPLRTFELANQTSNGIPLVGDRTKRPNLNASLCIRHSHRDGVLVHSRPTNRVPFFIDRLPSHVALRQCSNRCVTYDAAIGVGRFILTIRPRGRGALRGTLI